MINININLLEYYSMFLTQFKKITLISLIAFSSSAMAGQWQIKMGGSAIAPSNDTQTALGNVKADSELAFTPSVEYFFNDYISAELLLATPVSHDVLLDGNKVANIKHLPPTLTAKYNFKNATRFTPYIGVGATAFIAWDETGVAQKVKEDYGFAGQIGFNFQPADAKNWGVFADVRYAKLNPEVTLTQDFDHAKFNLKIDPVIYTLGYSFKF